MTASSPDSAAAPKGRSTRTKDKLKHSRNETRRRARIREQFESLRIATNCSAKDRYHILQYAIDVVQSQQLRIGQLERLVSKYEDHTKQRFSVSPLPLSSAPLPPLAPSSSPVTAASASNATAGAPAAQPKRPRSERAAANRRMKFVDDEDEDEQQSYEDANFSGAESEDEAEVQRASAHPTQHHSRYAHSETVGSTLSSSAANGTSAPAPILTGTGSAAANVLATLASAASESAAGSSSTGSAFTTVPGTGVAAVEVRHPTEPPPLPPPTGGRGGKRNSPTAGLSPPSHADRKKKRKLSEDLADEDLGRSDNEGNGSDNDDDEDEDNNRSQAPSSDPLRSRRALIDQSEANTSALFSPGGAGSSPALTVSNLGMRNMGSPLAPSYGMPLMLPPMQGYMQGYVAMPPPTNSDAKNMMLAQRMQTMQQQAVGMPVQAQQGQMQPMFHPMPLQPAQAYFPPSAYSNQLTPLGSMPQSPLVDYQQQQQQPTQQQMQAAHVQAQQQQAHQMQQAHAAAQQQQQQQQQSQAAATSAQCSPTGASLPPSSSPPYYFSGLSTSS